MNEVIQVETGQALPIVCARGDCIATSSDEAIVSVRQQDFASNNFLILGRTVGTAILSIRSIDGQNTDTYNIDVTAAPEPA